MIDKKIFEKFNLLPFSPSRLNTFRDFPCGFVMRYIYGYDFAASPPMIRGSAVEYGFNFYFTDGYSLDQCIQKAFNYYDDGVTFTMDKDKAEKERAFIEPMLKLIYLELPSYINFLESLYLGFQMKVSTEILGIPFSGYTDYAFENDERITVIDLKTKGKLIKKHSDMLQQTIYKKALEERYDKPVDVKILIVTPKKMEEVLVENTENYMKEIEMSLISCANMIKICKKKESLSSLITPNLDDWYWSDADKRSAREVIWGI
jgi:hypothetical protein